MASRLALIIFTSIWWALAAAAALAYAFTGPSAVKRPSGVVPNLLVITPFLVVPGLFLLGRYTGTYQGSAAAQIAGALAAAGGLAGYLVSHLYLRRSWSLAASVREGQRLVTTGPYSFMRHPMYTSMIVIVLGSGLLTQNYLMILSTVLVGLVYYVRARKEEGLLRQEFTEFAAYSSRVKMFIPFVF